MLELAVDGYLDERDRERATEGGREGGRESLGTRPHEL